MSDDSATFAPGASFPGINSGRNSISEFLILCFADFEGRSDCKGDGTRRDGESSRLDRYSGVSVIIGGGVLGTTKV
jgi:hypothetical protein